MRIVILVLVAATASSTAVAGTIRHDQSQRNYKTRADRTVFESVGRISTGNSLGSGVMITPTLGITAAHVLDNANSAMINLAGRDFSISTWSLHPEWNGRIVDGKSTDLAIFELTSPLRGSTLKSMVLPEVYRKRDEIGKSTTAVGFGRTGNGLRGQARYDYNDRAIRNVIDGHGYVAGKGYRDTDVLMADFDSPDRSYNLFGSSEAAKFEGLSASGDSGGGLFIRDAGNWYLSGITSYGINSGSNSANPENFSDYGDAAGYTRVSSFTPWIDSYLSGRGQWGHTQTGLNVRSLSSNVQPLTLSAVPEPGSLSIVVLGGIAGFTAAPRRVS